jgi:putative phage-type endonuclease
MSLTAEQIQARLSGIGGSDAAAALGLSKRKTALELYLEKRGEIAPEDPGEDNELIWWGRALEPIVRQRYAETTGRTVLLPETTIRHPAHGFMLAHVDGIISGERRGYEGKTAFNSSGWGESGTDEIPTDYALQVHHYLTVTEYEVWDVAVLIGRTFRIYEVARDLELSEMLIEREADFMRRVREGDPPSLDYDHPTARDVCKKLYAGTNGARLEASASAIQWRQELEDAKSVAKDALARADSLQARLLEEMGEAALLAFPDGKCFRRQKIQRAGYTVGPSEYMDFRLINDGKGIPGRKPPARATKRFKPGDGT